MAESKQFEVEPVSEDEQLVAFMTAAAPSITAMGQVPHVYANDTRNPTPFGVLDMFYRGVFTNSLGIMVGKDTETGKECLVLVGIGDKDGENEQIFPIALVLGEESTRRFLPPNGEGGYDDLTTN